MKLTPEMIEALRRSLDGVAHLSIGEAGEALTAALSVAPKPEPVAVADGWQLVPTRMDVGMIGAWYRYKNGWHSHDAPPPRDTSDEGAYRAALEGKL